MMNVRPDSEHHYVVIMYKCSSIQLIKPIVPTKIVTKIIQEAVHMFFKSHRYFLTL